MLTYIIPFVILILVVVFIHEYGHYYFAKKYGVGVTDFSIGFGSEIFGWNDKSGTRWKICWIPLGGYVKFFGDRNVFSQSEQQEIIKKYSEKDRDKLFILKPLYQRALIVAAGPLANFVLAIIIFTIINMFVGKDSTPAVINEVVKDSPAYVAGMKKSDEIIYNLIAESVPINNKYKKILKVNDDQSLEILQKIYDLAPFLYFLPETERLFQSSPSIRRRLIDQFIFTNQNNYNKLINKYTRLLQERSKLLLNNNKDESWLNQLEKNISIDGLEIYSLRQKQIKLLIDNLNIYLNKYNLRFEISVKLSDKYFIKNISQKDYENQLKYNRNIDSLIGGCNIGPHKSDFIFYVNDDYLVSQLSTGQQKTIILLMYLSQCKYLLENKGKKPILLLDEICSHLDEVNRNILMTLVESYNLQIFMTGTSKNLFSFLSTNTNFCNIID